MKAAEWRVKGICKDQSGYNCPQNAHDNSEACANEQQDDNEAKRHVSSRGGLYKDLRGNQSSDEAEYNAEHLVKGTREMLFKPLCLVTAKTLGGSRWDWLFFDHFPPLRLSFFIINIKNIKLFLKKAYIKASR